MGSLYQAARKRIEKLLKGIYPDNKVTDEYLSHLYGLIEQNLTEATCQIEKWDQTDTILITYGNSMSSKGEKPLRTLGKFLHQNLTDEIRCVHILPFFPYSSDDGFSVINYHEVNPELGNWKDVEMIRHQFDLMVDLVINHVSTRHQWFQNFLQGKSPGKEYFIEMDPNSDISGVTRPRSSPLLTKFNTSDGEKYVWTTFSEDQVDLDFSNPWVLSEMLKILFFYIREGARIIRLDAIAYLWKEMGTSSIHLPQTHRIVNLIRELAELIDPNVIIVTETNVPNMENLSYFGPNNNEAHMVYQFSLPPLLLHALHTGNSKYLTRWAQSMFDPGEDGTYLNFTASHDGIGIRPVEGILPKNELNKILQNMQHFGGYISSKTNRDGSESPYEINITWFDALKGNEKGEDALQVPRFLCSQTIMMSMKGIPAFYIHSLTATENDHEQVAKTGKYRSINRTTWDYGNLLSRLNKKEHIAHQVFSQLKQLIRIRIHQPAFHPNAGQTIMDLGNKLFALKRYTESGDTLWSISNITDQRMAINSGSIAPGGKLTDLITGYTYQTDKDIELLPYQTLWLTLKA